MKITRPKKITGPKITGPKITRRDMVAGLTLGAPLALHCEPVRAQTAAPLVLEAREAILAIAPDPVVAGAVWAFNGVVPGPLLRVKFGDELRLRLDNRLAQPIALHWQGVDGPNAMDGVAGLTQPAAAPGGSFEYRFTPPDSGLFWYRASAFPYAAEQKGRGLYGVLVVEEAAPPPTDHEALLVLDDWRIGADGAMAAFLAPADVLGEGRVGDLLTVNGGGAPQTLVLAQGARVRLRMLNACNARLAAFLFDGVEPLMIGIDGLPCEPFKPSRNIIPAGPGARFDLMFDLPRQPDAEVRVMLRGGGLRADTTSEADRALLVFRTNAETASRREPFAGLPLNPRLPAEIRLQNAYRLDLTVEASESRDPRQAYTINGAAGPGLSKPLFRVPRGQPVALGLFNRTQVAQTLHLHGHHMRVLHLLDDGWEPFWRDSVIVPPGRHARVAFLASNPGKWLIESSILEHAMSGVSAWFEVK